MRKEGREAMVRWLTEHAGEPLPELVRAVEEKGVGREDALLTVALVLSVKDDLPCRLSVWCEQAAENFPDLAWVVELMRHLLRALPAETVAHGDA